MVESLEEEIGLIKFSKALHDSDQIDARDGDAVRRQAGIGRVDG